MDFSSSSGANSETPGQGQVNEQTLQAVALIESMQVTQIRILNNSDSQFLTLATRSL